MTKHSEGKWYRELTPYQWRVLVCACLGWALDIMDGYLYAIILFPAMSDLLDTNESAVIGLYGGIVLSIFMIGWALGGLIFGPIADRYGRARTMAITILIYASFTGLCGIASSWQELALYRFLTALGIGVPDGLDGVSFLDDRGHRGHPGDAHLARKQADKQRGAKSAVA